MEHSHNLSIVTQDESWSNLVKKHESGVATASPPATEETPGSLALAADLEALGSLGRRFACTEQEWRMLDEVRARLPEGAVSRREGFVGNGSPAMVLGAHGLVALAGGLLGYTYPLSGAFIGLLTSASLIGEGTGRLRVLRWWLPRSPSYNLVVPPSVETATTGTVVITAPLDVPRSRTWRPSWLRRPLAAVLVSTLLITVLLVLRRMAEPWGSPLLTLYGASMAVLAVTVALAWVSRRETAKVASDASGVAVALEVDRRLREHAIGDVAVWTVFTGCGRAHQEGMEAFLSLRGARLTEPVLVMSLHDVGRTPLMAVASEGPLWAQHQRPTGPALVERLKWAGVRLPIVDRAEPSDARMAMIMGFRGLCLAGGDGEPSLRGAARAADIVETLVRWYGQDLGRVEDGRDEVATWAAVADPTRS